MINFWMKPGGLSFYADTFYGDDYTFFIQVVDYKNKTHERVRARSAARRYNFYKHPTLDEGPLCIKKFNGRIDIIDVKIGIGFLTKGYKI